MIKALNTLRLPEVAAAAEPTGERATGSRRNWPQPKVSFMSPSRRSSGHPMAVGYARLSKPALGSLMFLWGEWMRFHLRKAV